MAEEFTTPPFLENTSVDDLFEAMTEIIPNDIDISQGSHTWNFLRPTALMGAYMCQYVLPQVIQLIYPSWSYGEFLDAHASTRGMSRKAAAAASGTITITGSVGTSIPRGSVFSTVSLNSEDTSIDYATTAAAKIGQTGSVKVPVRCTQTGTIGNTTENTVVIAASRITGIKAVTNEAPITGGTDEEDDASLIARIVEYDRTQGESFTGNVADYKRWAKSVSGVGSATVIPAQNDSGLVTIIVVDANGDPATTELCTAVYNYIMSPDDEDKRLAPINAFLNVQAPTTLAIGIKATVELEEGARLAAVKNAFLLQVQSYLQQEATEEKEVKITRIGAILLDTEGVNDYSGLQIGVKSGSTVNYGVSNITISNTQLPSLAQGDLALTTGQVGDF